LLLPILITNSVEGSNILMVIPMGSVSHKNVFIPMAQEMGQKGHDVNMVSLYESNNFISTGKAYNDIVATQAQRTMKNLTGEFDVFKMHRESRNPNKEMFRMMIPNIVLFCDAFIRDPALTKIWNSKPDLIILPAIMNECGLIFVHKFKVPFIYMTTSGLPSWTSENMGYSENPSYVPNQFMPYSEKMTFKERLINSIAGVALSAGRNYKIIRPLNSFAQEFLNDTSVSLYDIDHSASLTLVNSHHSLASNRPLLPSIVEVGGMQCRPSRDLYNIDRELKQFLDNAGHKNTVFFSLGSIIKSSQMSPEFLEMIVNAFNELPYSIIWKYEGERPANLSSNVIVRKWIPQQDLLGHSSIGAFFTHAGILSVHEAVYHAVPMIALPFYSDQDQNARNIVNKGIGVQLDIKTLTKESIKHSINEVMTNTQYRIAVRRLSKLFKDRESRPVERAVYWMEYILRHNGAVHLQPISKNLNFIQLYLIDVIALSIFSVLVMVTILYYISVPIKSVFKFTLKRFVQIFKLLMTSFL